MSKGANSMGPGIDAPGAGTMRVITTDSHSQHPLRRISARCLIVRMVTHLVFFVPVDHETLDEIAFHSSTKHLLCRRIPRSHLAMLRQRVVCSISDEGSQY